MSKRLEGIGMTSRRTRMRLVDLLREKGISDERVLAAIGHVPRHIFVDEALAHRAYEDTPLPVGFGQTISQPYIVALMTQVLLERAPKWVLEVGTGTGYQTAVLSSLVQRVFTIERIEELQLRAQERLRLIGADNIRFRVGDGYEGWPAESPFDAILVTAAPPEVPPALLDQLADGGRLVLPVGGEGVQELKVIDRRGDELLTSTVDYVRFVPLLKGVRPVEDT
ncbi:MAG: protein-L-isoaspartate(D-aspartate) O-methyltransferase [Pseudomonadales bacterium]|nr:protein-L-isoaspartate(D-aspartate) O-methyltransferase [Pseudomonadales bacterium]MCP5182848.1 protein-L-isoaspartate(D-aspartate) O-methyltransferase [Pseudomonadales bacterium]